MKTCKIILAIMTIHKKLFAFENKRRFRLLFNLEELNFCLRWDSNPGPCTCKTYALTTRPNFPYNFCPKNFSHLKFTFFAVSPFVISSNRQILSKSRKDDLHFSHEPLDRFDSNFQKISSKYIIFQNIYNSSYSKLVGRKVNYTNHQLC